MSAGMKGSMNINALSIFCRYTNHDYVKIRTDRTRLDIYRERCKLCHATGANPVSPNLFGNCFPCEDE